MLSLITQSVEIQKLQSRLESEMKSRGSLFYSIYKTRGLPDGILHEAFYFKQFNIYWKSGDSSRDNRYWNSFGVGQPPRLRDAFQLNVPKEGVYRRVQGGFLRSGSEAYLLHRGALGGG